MADGTFQRAVGENVKLDPKYSTPAHRRSKRCSPVSSDLTYAGPIQPSMDHVNNGEALRIIAGRRVWRRPRCPERRPESTRRGFSREENRHAAARKHAGCGVRAWLMQQGFKLKEQGGDTQVIPVANPDILTLFQKKEIDGAWVPEPWAPAWSASQWQDIS